MAQYRISKVEYPFPPTALDPGVRVTISDRDNPAWEEIVAAPKPVLGDETEFMTAVFCTLPDNPLQPNDAGIICG